MGGPRKILGLVVKELCSSFGKDDKTKCLCWGSEVGTQVKSIDKTLRLCKSKGKSADQGMEKALEAIKVIITTAKDVGVEHEKFQTACAYQCTFVGSGTQGVQGVPLAWPPRKIKDPF